MYGRADKLDREYIFHFRAHLDDGNSKKMINLRNIQTKQGPYFCTAKTGVLSL